MSQDRIFKRIRCRALMNRYYLFILQILKETFRLISSWLNSAWMSLKSLYLQYFVQLQKVRYVFFLYLLSKQNKFPVGRDQQ